MTSGSFKNTRGMTGFASQPSSFDNIRHQTFTLSHLRTWKSWLWKKINQEDLNVILAGIIVKLTEKIKSESLPNRRIPKEVSKTISSNLVRERELTKKAREVTGHVSSVL